MTHLQSVRDTLRAAAQTGAVVNACPVTQGATDALRHVVALIDRTSLPRRIQITLSDETSLTLDAQNRRLLQFSVTPGARTDGIIGAVPAPSATICASKDAAHIARQLSDILGDQSLQRQRVVEDGSIPLPTTSGVSASALFQGIQDGVGPDTSVDLTAVITGIIRTAPATVQAACVLDAEDLLAITGSDEELFAMADWAKTVLGDDMPDSFPKSCKLEYGGICALHWPHATPRQLLIVNGPEQVGLILVEDDQNTLVLKALKTQLNLGSRGKWCG